MRVITSSVLRKNRRMKGRIIGISLLMALATGMFIMGLYNADSLEYSVDKQVETSNFPDYFISFSSMEDRTSLTDLMNGHLTNGSLQAYDLRIVVEGFYIGADSRYPAIFVGVADPARDDINRFQLADGTYFSGAGQAMVQKGMEAQGLDVGSDAEFRILGNNVSLHITGTGISTEHIGTGTLSMGGLSIPGGVAVVILPVEELEALMGMGVNSLIILSSDPQTVLASLEAYNVSQILAQEDTAALVMLRMGVDELRNVMPVMSLLFLAVGVVATTMIFSRVVENDGRLIGVLMAMGYRNGEVVRAYMSFGLLIGAISSILGVVFGYVISIYMLDVYKVFLADIDMYPADTVLPFLLAVAINFIAILLAMTLPLLRLRRATVKEALEHRKNDRLHISRISLPGSKMSLMGLRNTFRNPRQTFTTLLVVGLAVGVAGSWVILGGSALNYLSDQMENETWDMEVNFAVPQDVTSLTEAGLGLPSGSTEKVIPFMTMLGTVHHSSHSADSLLVGSSDLLSVKSFSVLKGQANVSGAIVSKLLADDLHLDVGDLITMSMGSYNLSLPVTAVVDDVSGLAVYTSMDNLPSTGIAVGVHIILSESSSVTTVSDALFDHPAVTAVIVKDVYAREMQELIDMSIGMFYAFFLLNGIITFIIAGAAVTIIASERELEYATIKSMGVRDRDLSKSIIIETGLLATGSVLVGIPSAYAFALLLGKIYEEMVFYFPIHLGLEEIAITVILGFVFIMASSIIPIRTARKVDMESVIRERVSG